MLGNLSQLYPDISLVPFHNKFIVCLCAFAVLKLISEKVSVSSVPTIFLSLCHKTDYKARVIIIFAAIVPSCPHFCFASARTFDTLNKFIIKLAIKTLNPLKGWLTKEKKRSDDDIERRSLSSLLSGIIISFSIKSFVFAYGESFNSQSWSFAAGILRAGNTGGHLKLVVYLNFEFQHFHRWNLLFSSLPSPARRRLKICERVLYEWMDAKLLWKFSWWINCMKAWKIIHHFTANLRLLAHNFFRKAFFLHSFTQLCKLSVKKLYKSLSQLERNCMRGWGETTPLRDDIVRCTM